MPEVSSHDGPLFARPFVEIQCRVEPFRHLHKLRHRSRLHRQSRPFFVRTLLISHALHAAPGKADDGERLMRGGELRQEGQAS